MCGRYYVNDKTAREIEKMIRDLDMEIIRERGDKRPTNSATVILQNDNDTQNRELKTERQKWGFLREDGKGVIINARAETIFTKRTFSEAVQNRRCIIPAGGFYEWDRHKNKYTFYMKDGKLMFMAGCYSYFEDGNRFVIITTQANDSISNIHDRMPLILEQDMLKDWIYEPARTDELLKSRPPLLEVARPEFEQLSLDISR